MKQILTSSGRPALERLQYIALALIVFGCSVAVLVLVTFAQKFDQELKQLKQIAQTQQQTIDQIKAAVNEVEGDNKKNTDFLKCLINLHASGIVPTDQSCQTLPAELQSSAITSGTSSPAVTPTAQLAAPLAKKTQDHSQPQPTLMDRVNGLIKGLLKRVGL